MKKQKGMTLLELTVVILVLISLLVALFMGVRTLKQSIPTRKCLSQQEQYEFALLRYVGCKNLKEGSKIQSKDVLIHDGINSDDFKCPEGGTYTFDDFLQFTKKPAIQCSKHKP